ncbi:hypothetical protein COEREDRAFT_81450, partial [Coemansia reversa NRRL 1564]
MIQVLKLHQRTLVVLIAVGVLTTTFFLAQRYCSIDLPVYYNPKADEQLLERLAIILPVNNNTDMQFYRNMWVQEYLYPLCDWPEPGCKIACNGNSTYMTLDKKIICFSSEIKNIHDKDFFIKLNDDAFVEIDYVVNILRKFGGWSKPVYISHNTSKEKNSNPGFNDNAPYV